MRLKLTFLFVALYVCKASLFAQQVEWAELSLQKIEQLQTEYADKVDAAFAAMEAVKKAGAYVESISDLVGDGQITLPVGIKKGEYELIIQRLRYDEGAEQTLVYATCAFQLKSGGQKVAFGGEAVLQGQRGLGTKGELALLAPVRINLGRESAIVVQRGTKANFGCEGVESFAAKMTWLTTSDNLEAVSSDGTPLGTPLAASFETTFAGFDSYVMSLDVNQHFAIKGLQGVVFSIRGAVVDQSDTETSTAVSFPQDYFSSSDEVPLWRGVALTGASVTLPPFLKMPNGSEDSPPLAADSRITLALDSALFDANGFSGGAHLALSSTQPLPQAEWGATLSTLSLKFYKNSLSAFRFAGEMNIPPLGSSSYLPYMAAFNPAINDYEFQVNFSGQYDFPVIKSKLDINESSYVNVHFVGSECYPTLNASGKLSITAPLGAGEEGKGLVVPDITFENMRICREQPYFAVGAIGVEGSLKSPEVAGFSMTIDALSSFDEGNGNAGLAFTAGVGLSDMFSGTTSLKLYGDYAKWKFKTVEVDRVKVDYRSKAFSVMGDVWFKNGDPIYGDGFRGDVKLDLIEKFDLDAVAVFGKVNGYRYFLTDVFLETSVAAGIPVGCLSFYGFGGGLYSKMQQQPGESASDFGKSLSGINYIPDKRVGMGFMASTKFALSASESGFNAKVGLEMQFNANGGINFVQLRGDAALMNMPEGVGTLVNSIGERVQQLDKEGGQLKEAQKSSLGAPKNNAFLSASLLMKYDIANSTFNADMNTYLNAAGIIKGVGDGGCMGWASAQISPDTWYLHIGTPSDRLGIEVLGLARAQGYFMLGDGIPALPPPPQRVLDLMSSDKRDKLLRSRNSEQLSKGTGIAFGAGMELKIKPVLPPFYASLEVGMGSEFLLRNLKGVTCSNSSGAIGINGWYAEAQAWAYVDAAIGVEAKIFRKTRKFDILSLTAGTLLAGAGPNPMHFQGMVGGRFSVMGGLISGNCRFEFEVGEECKDMKGGNPFGEDIIAQLTPATGTGDVNVFTVPQAVFNIPVGLEMTIDEDDGSRGTYMVTLEDFSLKYKDGRSITLQQQLSTDGTVCALDPLEPFESKAEITAYAKVGFKQKVNGAWQYVKGDDGRSVFEDKTETFTSGERPKEFMPEHVKYAYPVARQYNFYPNEYPNGYVQLSENYEYLFTTEKPEGCDQRLRIASLDGKAKHETDFTYRSGGSSGVKFEVHFSMEQPVLEKNQIYKLSIVNVPRQQAVNIKSNISASAAAMQGQDEVTVTKQAAEGMLAQVDEKEIYAIHFRTSSYGTFAEKMAAIPNDEGGASPDYPHVYNLFSSIYDYTQPAEMFDVAEVAPSDEGGMVVAEPIYERTEWYTQLVAPLMYNTRLLSDAGLPNLKPATRDVITIGNGDPKRVEDELLSTGGRLKVKSWGNIQYRVSAAVDDDYCKIRNGLANSVMGGNKSAETQEFLSSDHIPDLRNGAYPVRFSYRLPGAEGRITSSVERTISLKGFID